MADIADAILDGVFCQHCGAMFDDRRAPGHPRSCSGCITPEELDDRRQQRLRELGAELNGEEDPDFVGRDEQRQHSKDKRASNREQSANLLRARGIVFESKNNAAHLIVRHAGRVVDFWPGTGKYMERGPYPAAGRGVFELLKELKRKKEKT